MRDFSLERLRATVGLAVLLAGAGLAGHALAGHARRGAEQGPESVTEQARRIDRALSASRPPLPDGMPTPNR